MSRENETRFIVQQESWEFKCALNESIFNSKKNWNRDECRWESKELNDRASFEKKKIYMWNHVNTDLYVKSDCECNKECKFDEYLDTKNCSCKNI